MFKNLQMQNKELQDGTKDGREQMSIVPIPAQMPQNPMLSAVLIWLLIFQISLFSFLTIISLFVKESNLIINLLSGDIITTALTSLVYRVCCCKNVGNHCG